MPEKVRFPTLDLAEPLSEMEVQEELLDLAGANVQAQDSRCFLGAGAYHHYSPALLDYLVQRGEFLTAYTPYQPEVSQGTLQVIYEYQSMICALTGMPVANASHYDGGTSLAEAVIMADAHFRGKRKKIILSPAVHPQYRQVARTYTQGMGLSWVGVAPDESALGRKQLLSLLDANTALFVVQTPNFFGQVEDLAGAALLLASEAASFITGHVLTVDGGQSLLSPHDALRKAQSKAAGEGRQDQKK